MPRKSKWEISWTDAELKDAVAAATNWRDVMRALGLRADSAGAIRIVKRHVIGLGLDTSHFRGKRTWSETQLRRAVIDAQSWDELLTRLGAGFNADGDQASASQDDYMLQRGRLDSDSRAEALFDR